ncbi:MAG: class I SAM-dependent methyltransferase [Bacteroidia bacterium]
MREDITEIFMVQPGKMMQYFQETGNEFLLSQNGVKYPIDENIICFPDKMSLTGNNRNYQQMYDRFARFYDFATRSYAWFKNGNEKNRVMQYLSYLKINNGDKVIEISIGTGRNIKYLNPTADFYGVDISFEMLKQCQRKMKQLNREIVLIQAEAENLPIKDESFDIVFSAGGFNFFNDPGKAVLEMLRIAKDRARLLITDETEKLRLKYSKSEFYKASQIRKPTEYLPEFCKDIEYKEICDGDLYVLTFMKP